MNNRSRAGKPTRHISYANVVATMALFIALGGISWAAATAPKNSVASKSIKKNAVTNAKIKNNAVTSRKIKSNSVLSSDVKNDALTGADINEGTLGAVPEAGKLSGQFSNVVNAQSSASNASEAVARAAATEVPLASYGSISIYGKCFKDTTDDQIEFEVFAKTTANGGFTAGDLGSSSLGAPALNTSTPEVDRALTNDETDAPGNDVDDDYAELALVLGPDGKGMRLQIITFGRLGNPADPSVLLPGSDSCQFRVEGRNVG